MSIRKRVVNEIVKCESLLTQKRQFWSFPLKNCSLFIEIESPKKLS